MMNAVIATVNPNTKTARPNTRQPAKIAIRPRSPTRPPRVPIHGPRLIVKRIPIIWTVSTNVHSSAWAQKKRGATLCSNAMVAATSEIIMVISRTAPAIIGLAKVDSDAVVPG